MLKELRHLTAKHQNMLQFFSCRSGVVNNVVVSFGFTGHCKDLFTSGSNHTVLCVNVSYIKLW
jgi:hypothetical protein